MRTFFANGQVYTLTGEPYIYQNSDCPSPILRQDLIDEDGEKESCVWDCHCHSFGEEDINDMSDFTTVWMGGEEFMVRDR